MIILLDVGTWADSLIFFTLFLRGGQGWRLCYSKLYYLL